MEKKEKILWLASWFPTSHSSFNGDFIERMGKAVAPYCEIILLHVGEGPVNKTEVIKTYEIFQRVLVTVPFSSKYNYVMRFFRLWKGVNKGVKIVNKIFGQSDLIHLHVMFPLGIFYYLKPYFWNLPLVITEHWTAYRKVNWHELSKAVHYGSKIISNRANYVLPVNKELGNDLKKLGIGKQYIEIPNVVDCELFNIKAHELHSQFVFLHVSSLIEKHKNVRGIIKAFKEILENHENVQLKVVGDGVGRQSLEALVDTLNIKNKVIFVGELSHSSVASEMQIADCLVHFSNYENLPCVILEAMASGLPVIATETGGMAEWVTAETGILVESGNLSALVSAMETMINGQKKYNPLQIRNSVMARCTPEVVGHQIVQVYQLHLGRSEPDFNSE